MKIPHFFKAYSRIGLKNPPHRMKKPNLGVEEGPDAVLNSQFLSSFSQAEASSFYFSQPDSLTDQEFNQILASEMADFKDQIFSDLSSNEIQVVVGGDHSVTFSSILASLQRWGNKNLGYIHIDSHPDANLSKTSPTQNFHGMYLRPLLSDDFDIPEINNLVDQRFLPENTLFIGNLDIDPGEKFLFDKLNILNIKKLDLVKDPEETLEEFQNFINRFDYLHVNFDIDAMDHSLAPATGIPAKNGLTMEDIQPLLEIIKNHPNFAFDLSEVNPQKKGDEQTVQAAQKILRSVLS